MKQALVHQFAVAISNGLIHPLAIVNRPLPGAWNTAGIVEANDHWNRQIAGHIQPFENLDPNIEIRSTLSTVSKWAKYVRLRR